MPSIAMFVMNSVEFDRRVLREAASLVRAGHDVRIVGVAGEGRLPLHEVREDGVEILRIPVGWAPATTGRSTASVKLGETQSRPRPRPPRTLHWLVRSQIRWWRWSEAAVTAAGRADVYHGHDLPGLGVAIAARNRNGGRVIYDSHDLFIESGANAQRQAWAKRILARMERGWYTAAEHLIVVNRGIGDELHRRYGPIPTSIVHNCVPRWAPTDADRALLRRAVGAAASQGPLVLYHGGFSAARGLGHLIRSMEDPRLAGAHLVLLGFGPMEAELRRLAERESVRGRVHVLPPVSPDQLDRIVSGADVVAIVNQPHSLNERLSTPNKLFEAIGAGVPVVSSDFPLRREIVLEDPAGAFGDVCDPEDPTDIARSVASLVGGSHAARAELRRRCLAVAHRRWNWESQERSLLDAYSEVLAARPHAASRRRWSMRLGQDSS